MSRTTLARSSGRAARIERPEEQVAQ
ncbi:hypothetical protein RZ50_010715, partial [Kitasatospora sp. SUK 42]|nr:hypothetical protein [Kitasatospora sp. SUK 42]